jgi:hypothetical protein
MTSGAIGTTGLRPLSVGELLDTAVNVYRRNATTFWTILAVIIVPIQVIELILTRLAVGSVTKIGGSFYKVGGGSAGGLVVLLIVTVLSIVAILIANGATVKAVGEAYLGHSPDWRASLGYAGSRIWGLLGLAIVLGILLTIGYILIIIPGIYLTVIWCAAIPAFMIEGLPALGSMQRSSDLVRGRWWATFGRVLAAIIVYAILYAIVTAIGGAIAGDASSYTVFLIIRTVFTTIAALLLTPFVAAVFVVLYIDLRVRKEAFDIEALAQTLGAPTPSPVSGAPAAPAAPGGSAPPSAGGGASPPPPGSQPPPN